MAHKVLFASAALALLAACGGPNDDSILPGERVSHRTGFAGGETASVSRSAPLALGAPQANSAWTHRGGSAQHTGVHAALGAQLQPLFVQSIGSGNSTRARMTAQPVLAEGRVYTLDAHSTVTAVSPSGAVLWQADVLPLGVQKSAASGGGLAFGEGKLFVTTSYGRVTALNPASGAKLWEHDLDAPAGASPTYSNGLLYVVGRDARGWALDAATGRVRFGVSGNATGVTLAGGAGVATDGTLAVFPFASGELLTTYAKGGLRQWSGFVAGRRLGDAGGALLGDIAGDPVIAGNRVYAANVMGEIAAFDLRSGEMLWSAREGASGGLTVIGGSIFFVSDRNALVRLEAQSGAKIWSQPLPLFVDEAPKKYSERFVHYGPVLAGGRLLVASSDGTLRQFDPTSGASLGTIALGAGAASAPVVAGQTLYLLTQDGQLRAFR